MGIRAELRNYVPKTSFMTPCHSVANLISFGEEVYNAHLNDGCMYYRFQTNEGNGFISYQINADIEVKEIYVNGVTDKASMNIYESLIYCLRNDAAALGKKLVIINADDKCVEFLTKRNSQMAEQKVEEKYKWTLIQ